MKAFFRSFFAALLAIVVLVMLVVGIAAFKFSQKEKIEDGSYLLVDLYGPIAEYPPPGGGLSQVMGGEPENLQRILDNLAKAAVDDRVPGVVLKFSSGVQAGPATIQEIRGGLKKVQAAGKPVYGWADSFTLGTYMLGSLCDSLYVPPSAWITFHGVALTSTHIRGTLDKLGIVPKLHKIKDYKAAAEMIMDKQLSPEAKENEQWVLDDIWAGFAANLAEDRGLSDEQAEAIMELAVLSAEEAAEHGLVDGLFYWHEFEDLLIEDEDATVLETVSQGRYAEESMEDLGLGGDHKIAVVHAQGMIGGRHSRVDPILGPMMGHESVIADLRRARDDEDIAAVIFRIDSGGGESLASDLMCNAIEQVTTVKPVVVSMTDVAASGGYYIAYAASKIVADPATVTGSIGSISGKFNTSAFHEKLGITHDFVSKGPNALFWSSQHDFSDEQWERFKQNHWDGFNMWLQDIADHRGMSFAEAELLAHGRIWTGNQAAANGLIDAVGGLDVAVELAKELAEIPADEGVTLLHYPERKDFVQSLLSGEGGFALALNWALHRFLHEDLEQTWRALQHQPVRMTIE
jgi:protease-4